MTREYGTQTESINHLVALLQQVRPQWDVGLVRIVLLNLAPQVELADLIVAATRCAVVSDYPTPKAIGWRGKHWDGLGSVPGPAAPSERCDVCSKPEPRCYGERVGIDDDHTFAPRSRVVRA